MRNAIFLMLGLLLLQTNFVFGQSTSDSITIVKKGPGTSFYQNSKKLTTKELTEITRSNSEAFKEMTAAKTNQAAGTVFGFIGGFLVGWPLGTAIGGGDPNWTLAAVGAGFIGVSIPFSIAYTKRATRAVDIYNADTRTSSKNKLQLNFGVSQNRIGLKMKL
jgi:uncharacterized protein YcfJ